MKKKARYLANINTLCKREEQESVISTQNTFRYCLFLILSLRYYTKQVLRFVLPVTATAEFLNRRKTAKNTGAGGEHPLRTAKDSARLFSYVS